MKTQLLTPKLRSAIAASLSVVLAFLFPLYFGIQDTSSAAITVMVIATSPTLGNSLEKGLLRVIGTIIGAIIGITLIGLFPQERFAYFAILSLFVFALLYLARAYRGDRTVFLLSAMTMMVVFKGGEVDGIYLYAMQKTLLTIIGILIYTTVTLYLFPPTPVTKEEEKELFHFVWGDLEDIKGAFISFLVFCTSSALWIYFEIPQGHMITVMATTFSLYTTYSIVKPKILIFLFSASFVVATLSYIFILPHLNGWWELSVFLFVYSFIGFYFIHPQISIFYLLGLSTFMIQNQMFYSIELFMFILLIFYMFLFLLLFFDYFPFNQKSHYMFYILKERFFTLLEKGNTLHLQETLNKLKTYATMLDYEYFGISKEEVEQFLKLCQEAIEKKEPSLVYNYKNKFTQLYTQDKF